jgi:ABC-type dipeptide transport system, periplasmic component
MRPTRALPAIAAAAATALGLASCAAGDTSPPTSKAKALDLVYNTPERKGPVDEVTWLLAGEPAGFDTDRAGGSNENTVVANVCERLFQQQPDLSIEPWIAESYRQPDDATLVLRIRDGVVFHDGSRLDAADVVYSLKRHAAEGNEEADEFSNVRSISRTGAMDVTLKLKRPDSQLIGALAADAGIVQDEQATERQGEDYGTPGSADACSGPYQIAEWEPGASLTLTRFDKHWNPDVKGGPKRVTFTWAESAAAVNTLTAGEADGAYLSSPALVPALAKSKRLRTFFGPSTMVYSLVPPPGAA